VTSRTAGRGAAMQRQDVMRRAGRAQIDRVGGARTLVEVARLP